MLNLGKDTQQYKVKRRQTGQPYIMYRGNVNK